MTCLDAAAELAASSCPIEPPGSAPLGSTSTSRQITLGAVVKAAFLTAQITCPNCDGNRLDAFTGGPCETCSDRGIVCSWCYATIEAANGACFDCGSTAAHRTTFASLEAWTAAYDPATWEGISRRGADHLASVVEDRDELRSQYQSLRTERDLLRRQVEAAKAELMAYVDRASAKIQAQHREYRAEIEDLQRQLRRGKVQEAA